LPVSVLQPLTIGIIRSTKAWFARAALGIGMARAASCAAAT
jgi:hypothetical protein